MLNNLTVTFGCPVCRLLKTASKGRPLRGGCAVLDSPAPYRLADRIGTKGGYSRSFSPLSLGLAGGVKCPSRGTAYRSRLGWRRSRQPACGPQVSASRRGLPGGCFPPERLPAQPLTRDQAGQPSRSSITASRKLRTWWSWPVQGTIGTPLPQAKTLK
jgi:hypothetical protein